MPDLTDLYALLKANLTTNKTKILYSDTTPKKIANFKDTLAAINCDQINYAEKTANSITFSPNTSPTDIFTVSGGTFTPFPKSVLPKAAPIPAVLHFKAGPKGNVFLFIICSPDNKWNLGKTFDLPAYSASPDWQVKPSFLSTLTFTNQRLILAGSGGLWFDESTPTMLTDKPTTKATELQFGLNFIGTHDQLKTTSKTNVLKLINLLYQGPSPKVVGNIYNYSSSGQLYLSEKFKDIDLSFPNPAGGDEITLLSISDAKLLYQSAVNNVSLDPKSQPSYDAGIQLYAKLNFAGDGAYFDVVYDLPFGDTKTVVLKSQLITFNPGALLTKITGGAIDKLIDTTPQTLKDVANFDAELKARNLEVAFNIEKGKKRLNYLSSTLTLKTELNNPWVIATINDVEFKANNPELGFVFGWDENGKINDKRLAFGASVLIGLDSQKDLILDLRVALTSGEAGSISLNGAMRSGEFSLKSIVKALTSDGIKLDALPEMVVTALSLSASSGKTKTLEFGMAVKSDWKPIPNCDLELSQITVQTNYDSAAKKTKIKGLLAATMKLGDRSLYVLAQKQELGWLFNGELKASQPIKIGDVLKDLSAKFLPSGQSIPCPDVIRESLISKIAVDFEIGTAHDSMNFTLEGQIPIGDQMVDFSVLVNRTKSGESQTFEFTGYLEIGYRNFNFVVKTENGAGINKNDSRALLLATYKSSGSKWLLKSVVNSLSSEIAQFIPGSLSITLKDAFFVLSASKKDGVKSPTTFLLGIDVGATIDLTDLPLIGSKLPAGTNMAIDNLRVMVASQPLVDPAYSNVPIIEDINRALEEAGIEGIPDQPNSASTVAQKPSKTNVILQKGLNFSCNLTLNEKKFPVLMAPAKPKSPVPKGANLLSNNRSAASNRNIATPTNANGKATPRPPKPGRGATWVPIQKSIGPIHFDRIGVAFEKGELTFLMDADLIVGKLCLSLEGLSAASPINHFSPHFDLAGIGISYKSPAVDIGGALLKSTPTPDNAEYAYNGFLQVRAKKLTLSALGSYANLKTGEPSFFVYVNVDYPLGGPAFFFVMGFTAGFGYNRRLNIPTLDQMDSFPLVSQALNGAPAKQAGETDRDYLMNQLSSLKEWIPPAVGEYFIAAGIKFTTFKIVNSFALLAFSFGKRMRIDLFGHTFLVHPPVSPDKILSNNAGAANQLASLPYLVSLKMDLMASYLPKEGILEAKGAIKPGSYIYSPLAQIDGNFAFKSWFKGNHEGDFVFALGGYHPAYKPPAHYPSRSWLRPLSIHYGINPNLYVKGSMYFALTPGSLMAGGVLEAVFNAGPLNASFNAYADFLVYFKPFHYDARIGVDVHINFSFEALFVTVHVSLNAGAQLHVWGPDFSGTAHVYFLSFSRTISFGEGKSAPPAITWNEFKESFLPKDEAGLTVNCHSGLTQTYKHPISQTEAWLVDPKTLCFTIESAIPITKAWYSEQKPGKEEMKNGVALASHKGVGIKPMHTDKADFKSELFVYITTDKTNANDADDFMYEPIYKNQPAGLWGEYEQSGLSDQVVPDVLAGLEIRPGKPPKSSATTAVYSNNLNYNTEVIPRAFNWEKIGKWTEPSFGDPESVAELLNAFKPKSLGLDDLLSDDLLSSIDVTTSDIDLEAYVASPQISNLSN